MQLTGAEIIVECLKEQGVDTVFGYPGGAILNVYDALYEYKDEITHVLTSHEQGASHAADGYARATGKVGVCLATSGPGATNLVTGIATAYMDSVPMVAITANVGRPLLGRDSFQEVDIAGIVMPVTKYSFIVKNIEDLADTLRRAFYIAKSGRPGPVLVDVPKDITGMKYEYEPCHPATVNREIKNIRKEDMDQALERAVDNGVKNLVVQPTHLMHGAEYDELTEAVENYKDKFESVKIAEPLLGEVGADETAINEDKAAVAEAITAEAVKTAGFDSLDAAKEEGTAFVFMGHGTSHTAKISYSQMQTQMEQLGYENVFIGTVEGEPEDTACEAVIEKLKNAGYKKVILRPLMVVAGDHANNDMAGDDDDSWKSQFEASGVFDSIDTQIAGLGEIDAIQQLYVAHTQAAIDAE